jgi:hypothetical protein
MLRVNYYKDGNAYSDFQVEEIVNDFVKISKYKEIDYEINTSTENIVYAVRVAIYAGLLDCDHVVMYTDRDTIKFDKNARAVNGNYPSTYIDEALFTLIGINKY